MSGEKKQQKREFLNGKIPEHGDFFGESLEDFGIFERIHRVSDDEVEIIGSTNLRF